MIIKKDSWHYKYVARYWDSKPQSLCWYFWKIPLTLVWWAAMCGTVVSLMGVLLFYFSVPFWLWAWPAKMETVIVSTLVWIAFGSCLSYNYRKYLYEVGKLHRKTPEVKEPGLVASFIKAKKEKVCPTLEYERSWH